MKWYREALLATGESGDPAKNDDGHIRLAASVLRKAVEDARQPLKRSNWRPMLPIPKVGRPRKRLLHGTWNVPDRLVDALRFLVTDSADLRFWCEVARQRYQTVLEASRRMFGGKALFLAEEGLIVFTASQLKELRAAVSGSGEHSDGRAGQSATRGFWEVSSRPVRARAGTSGSAHPGAKAGGDTGR